MRLAIRKQWVVVAAAAGLAGLSFSQSGRAPALPGSPLPGITATEQEMFGGTRGHGGGDRGGQLGGVQREQLRYTQRSAIGGVSTMTEVRGGYRDEDGNSTH
jgi:hypothetical protein